MFRCAEVLGCSVLTVLWDRWTGEAVDPRDQRHHLSRCPLRLCRVQSSSLFSVSLAKSPLFFSQITLGALLQGHGEDEGLNCAFGFAHAACAAGGNTFGESGVRAGRC